MVFGGAPCIEGTINAQTTSLSCELQHEPYGGLGMNVEVYDENGLVPIANGVSGIDIVATVVDV